jgi:prepilin-type N-terminal cleavage/methylation domain-containing protein
VKQSESGFTLVEVLIAVMVLGVGITALVGSSALVTRMVSRGQMSTRSAEVAAARLDSLRVLAYATTPRCTSPSLVAGSRSGTTNNVAEAWTIDVGAKSRTVKLVVTQKTARGRTHADTIVTVIGC